MKRGCGYKTPENCSHFYVFCRFDGECEFRGKNNMKKWKIDVESFLVEAKTEEGARAEAEKALYFMPRLKIENITEMRTDG